MKSILLTLILFIVGCATTSTSRVFIDLQPRTDYENVEIIYKLPVKSFRVVAEFEQLNATENSLKRKAASYGADALYVASYGSFYSGSNVELKNSYTDRTTVTNRESICTAIIFD